jgi:hypothetical protein
MNLHQMIARTTITCDYHVWEERRQSCRFSASYGREWGKDSRRPTPAQGGLGQSGFVVGRHFNILICFIVSSCTCAFPYVYVMVCYLML